LANRTESDYTRRYDPREASDFIESLQKSREELLAAAANVPEAQANTKPESGRWSVLECLEHVTISEEKLLARLEAAAAAGAADGG
jgi:uncharacterized damage-inducible protein DinB